MARKVSAKKRTADFRKKHRAAIVIQSFYRCIRSLAIVRAKREEARLCHPERSLTLIIAEKSTGIYSSDKSNR